MTDEDLTTALHRFVAEQKFHTKGALAVGLHVTERAKEGLPLEASSLLTGGGGQVSGLSANAISKILRRHGIDRPLSSMGGRSNRASPNQMKVYVGFLNAQHALGSVDLDSVERFWVNQVRARLAVGPLRLQFDPSNGMGSLIRNLVAQAEKRDAEIQGSRYTGAVLQHLVGAALNCVLDSDTFTVSHHGYAVADHQTKRTGDFDVHDTAIHVTVAPTEGLIQRCRINLDDQDVRPIIITTSSKKAVAEGLLENENLTDRVDVFDAGQFIAFTLYKLGGYDDDIRRLAIYRLVDEYNKIIDEVEKDPAMSIDIQNRRRPGVSTR